MRLHEIQLLRDRLVPLFARLNPGDITVRHAYLDVPIKLHSFQHRGFWFQAKKREKATMDLLRRLVTPGQKILEAGGHIGFVTLFLADLVGPGGKVVVFEPGENNLPYLKSNLARFSNVELIEEAVGDTEGTTDFYIESLTGQNNSMFADYEVFKQNQKSSNVRVSYQTVRVPITTIDSYCSSSGLSPDLIKIDIEGSEFEALCGAKHVLTSVQPMIMVEVTRREPEVVSLLEDVGYILLNDTGKLASRPLRFNVFALHSERHAEHIRGLLGSEQG